MNEKLLYIPYENAHKITYPQKILWEIEDDNIKCRIYTIMEGVFDEKYKEMCCYKSVIVIEKEMDNNFTLRIYNQNDQKIVKSIVISTKKLENSLDLKNGRYIDGYIDDGYVRSIIYQNSNIRIEKFHGSYQLIFKNSKYLNEMSKDLEYLELMKERFKLWLKLEFGCDVHLHK